MVKIKYSSARTVRIFAVAGLTFIVVAALAAGPIYAAFRKVDAAFRGSHFVPSGRWIRVRGNV